MKRVLAIILAMFVFIPFVNAEEINTNESISKTVNCDPAEIKDFAPTSEGITVNGSAWIEGYNIKAEFIYTITEEFDVEKNDGKVTLNFINDIYDSPEIVNYKGILPSSKIIITFTVINETKYKFEYNDESLIISTVKYEKESENKVTTFDGNEVALDSNNNFSRTKNEALVSLLKKTKDRNDYSDENIKTALLSIKDENGELVYPNGVQDLDKYYLDFYSKKDNKEYKSLSELSKDALNYLFGTPCGNYQGVRETNEVLAKFGYDYFYNNLLSVYPEDVKPKSEIFDYTVGSYMRDEAPDTLDKQLSDAINNNLEESTTIVGYLNGLYTGNAYQNYSFGLNVSVVLATPKYKVVAKYIDVDGNSLAQNVVNEYFDGKAYTTEEKVFEGYELVKVIGERTGEIESADVEVTYVYEFVMGEGGEEEKEVVQTGSEVDYSIITSAFITISLIGLAIYTHKKQN